MPSLEPHRLEVLAARWTHALRERRVEVGVGAALAAGLPWLGGASLALSLASLAAVVVWGATWPEPQTPARTGAVTGDGSRGDAGEAAIDPWSSEASFWRSVLSGIDGPALVLDRATRILAVNAAAEPLLAATEGNYLSLAIRSPELLTAIDRALSTGIQQGCEFSMPVPVERHLDGLVTPLAARTERPALLVVLKDRTERQLLAEMRADFVANASHELRTPLAAIRGFVETLQGPAKDDAVARTRFLGIMQTQTERMSRLIDDLLSLSRIEMHEHLLPTGRVDMVGVAGEAVTGLRGLAEDRGITLAFADPGAAAETVGDRDELYQVAQNLIQNAIKYGRKGGRVDVGIARQSSRVVLTVADDGIGIAPEHLPRLTERFYRVSAKDSRERGGTGLGLAIVKHIVNRHRGELAVMSRSGQGSTFTVSLPAAVRPADGHELGGS